MVLRKLNYMTIGNIFNGLLTQSGTEFLTHCLISFLRLKVTM